MNDFMEILLVVMMLGSMDSRKRAVVGGGRLSHPSGAFRIGKLAVVAVQFTKRHESNESGGFIVGFKRLFSREAKKKSACLFG